MDKIIAAICEDESNVLKYFHQQLTREFLSDSYDITLDAFTDGQLLLNSICTGKEYQIVFLDIEMPGINGIEVCRKIKTIHKDTLVIFISNKEEMVFQTFEVQPFRFIRKTHFKQELPALVSAIKKALQEKQGVILTIEEQHSNNVYSININHVLYIEVIGKYCHFVTTQKDFKVRCQLLFLAEQLKDLGFIQTHRSYLVNYRYIFSIGTTECFLDNHMRIPISHKRLREVKEKFLEFTRSV